MKDGSRFRVSGFKWGKWGLVYVSCILMITGCSRFSPAGFWKSYKPEFIVAQQSDQGPWGGWRWILWDTGKAGTFTEQAVRVFAEAKGWKFAEHRIIIKNDMDSWHSVSDASKSIFPLMFAEEGKGIHNLQADIFPRQIQQDSIVLKFRSGWINVDPGTGKEKTAFGYVQLSKDGKQLAVYHLWGE